MAASDFERIFEVLQSAGARYIVVGGVAVVLHGHARLTADLDLVIGLDPDNVRLAMGALGKLGYRPRALVPIEDFADPAARRRWVDEKGMVVFSLYSPDHPATEIDVFVEEPFPFDAAYQRAVQAEVGDLKIVVACLSDLIALKERAGRDKDLADVAALRRLNAESSDA